MSSNDLDQGLTVEPNRHWRTKEDSDLERIRNLAAALKDHPLLPPKLPGFDVQEADHASGILFPNVHCAIQGCVWCSKEDPCQPNWTHARVMQVQQQRWTERPQTCCGNARTCLRAQHMEGLVCPCCARIHVAANHGETGFQTVSDLFSSLTEDSFRANWCYDTYASRYANIPAIQQRLEHRQWVRQLPDGSNILCCPEDIRCVKCTPQSSTLCPRCRVPLCRTCLMRVTQRRIPGVPQALTNDNWLGYPTELLYRHRVRWVEAAAACPVWTSVVCFYLEQDRRHWLEEDIHKVEHRVAIRGNVSSFSMPWEDIMATLDPTHQGHRAWESLPHSPATLQALVKITVKVMRYNGALEWVSEAKIRPWVVIALLQHLVDLGQPTAMGPPS